MTTSAVRLFPWLVGCAFAGVALVAVDVHVASQRAADLCDALPRGTPLAAIRRVADSLSARPGVSMIYGLDDVYNLTAAPGRAAGRPFQSTIVVRFRGFMSAKSLCSILIRDGEVVNNFRG